MSKPMKITSDRVKEVLLADGVKPGSVSPYLTAWTWAESGKTNTGLSVATVRTYEAYARRVYQPLGQHLRSRALVRITAFPEVGRASARSRDPRLPDS
jgi:hypothetical protein